MSQQPALRYSWNTMVASSFWDMRLSIACAATDAEYQTASSSTTTPSTSPSWHGSPIRTPTTRRGGAPRCRRLEDQPKSRYQELAAPCCRLSCLLYGTLTRALLEFFKANFFYFCFNKSLLCFLRTPPPLRQTPSYVLVNQADIELCTLSIIFGSKAHGSCASAHKNTFWLPLLVLIPFFRSKRWEFTNNC